MKSFILASQNQHKAQELEVLLGSNYKVLTPSKKLDVIENGFSFQENALLKAQAYYNLSKSPVISDDSGLCLDAFPDILGIHSARYEPEIPSYEEKCTKLLNLYEKKQEILRSAYFISVLCLYLSENEIFFFEGRTKGNISTKLLGNQGFGYDPIFIPSLHENNLSYAQDPLWKEQNGHRAKACLSLKKFLA